MLGKQREKGRGRGTERGTNRKIEVRETERQSSSVPRYLFGLSIDSRRD